MKCVIVDTSKSPYAKLKPVPVSSVKLTDKFWAPRLKMLREVTLPSQYEILEKTGRIENFRVAARKTGKISWRIADDSDVYKWLEAASLSLAYQHSDELAELVDSLVKDISLAQDENGYLFTYYSIKRKEERWTNLRDMHELYCAGHLFQAAVAHFRATGKRELLNTAIKLADHILNIFGPNKRLGVPGHPEIEMALVELYRTTGKVDYLKLAEFFIDQRGKGLVGGSIYLIDHKPFRELDEIVGHAVRSLYLNCGATDVYMETGDESILRVLKKLWDNMTKRKMYITGGVGSRYQGEAFGEDYELPNLRAYAETCAAIANVMWNWRMLLALGEAKFTDVMELAIYNGALSGISLDGKHYFYVNPLADRGKHRRQPWYSCACCPTNIVRLLASIPGYLYSTSDDGIWTHLYVASEAFIDLRGQKVKIVQHTNYPWSGDVETVVEPEKTCEFSLFLRIPGWSGDVEVRVNGKPINRRITPGTYLEIERTWRRGDRVEIDIPMPIKLIVSNPRVLCNACRVAIKRGPIVYCLEQVDNPECDVWDVVLIPEKRLIAKYKPDVLGGIVAIEGTAAVIDYNVWKDKLYLPLEEVSMKMREAKLTAIPYYAWANREPGPMITWIKSLLH